MQHRLQNIIGSTIHATDGELGKVDEFYFDDETWNIRYLVVKTGMWLSERKVLISLVALDKSDEATHSFWVKLTSEQVRNSPDIDTQRPVYRQHEVQLHSYYRWPQYWADGYVGTFGISPYPIIENPYPPERSEINQYIDPHLRSTRQVTGYSIHATDGTIGHVEDFIVDDEKWPILKLIVDTGNWLPGKKVLVAPSWIISVNWSDTSIHLDRTRDSVQNCPEFKSPQKKLVESI